MANQPWFVVERADALAALYLTRRSDVEVIPVSRYVRQPGYDFLVRITRPNLSNAALFAVETKGFRSFPRNGSAQLELDFALSEIQGSELPICIFVFDVTTEEGRYRWLYEPVLNGQKAPYLRLNDEFVPHVSGDNGARKRISVHSPFEILNDESIEAIVDRVAGWYEAKRWAIAS